MSAWFWKTLGIAATQDKSAVRRAYADKLKAIDVDQDMAGFARLRQARDMALRNVATNAAKQDAGIEPEPITVLADEDGAATPVLPLGPTPEASPPVDTVSDRLHALARLLFPNGECSDEGFTLSDYQAALALVDDLLEEARTGRLEVSHTIDHNLANMFTDSWPRSGALVERPAAEFNWLDEAGSIAERSALRFLNDRIKGLRFVEKVQQADHRLHGAWIELSRPGRPTMVDKLRGSKADITMLLTGIRQRFPEVESHLDAERIAGWERRAAGWNAEAGIYVPEADRSPTYVRYIGFGLFLVIMMISRLISPTFDRTDPIDQPELELHQSAEETERAFDLALNQILGSTRDDAEIDILAPGFRDQLRFMYSAGSGASGDHQAGIGRARALARIYSENAKRAAEFEELVAIAEVRRRWLLSLLGEGKLGADCPLLSGGDGLELVVLDAEGHRAEQAMLIQLIYAGLFAEQPVREPLSAEVPGAVIDEAVAQTSLSDEQFRAALGDPDHPARCRMELGLLNVVLRQPGRVPVDLLRML